MPGTTYLSLLEHAQDNFGFVTTADARSLNIDPTQLRIMASRGQLEHRGRGIYRMPTVPSGELDEYMEAVLWTGSAGVVTHDSALLLYGLSDVNPSKIHLTVDPSFRTRKKVPAVIDLHREVLSEDCRHVHRGIPTVTPATAISQCAARGLGGELLRQAIAEARARGLLSTKAARGLERQLGQP